MKSMILFMMFVSILSARLDPFEPVTLKPIKSNKIKPYYTPDDKGRTVKLIPEVKHKDINNTKKVVIIKKEIKKPTKKECEVVLSNEINKLKQETKKKDKIIKKLKKIKVIEDNTEFIPVTYKILPFITIDIGQKYISAISRPKYKVLRYYFLKDEKKVVFDFRAKVNMRTRYKIIKNHPYFKAYKIGNHPELKDYFFRVVIELKKQINQFKVIINQNKATLIYKK